VWPCQVPHLRLHTATCTVWFCINLSFAFYRFFLQEFFARNFAKYILHIHILRITHALSWQSWHLHSVTSLECLQCITFENNVLLFFVAALWNTAGHCIFVRWFLLSIFLRFLLACSQPLQIWCLPYFHTWCGLSANLGCRCQTCCMWLAENAGCKKFSICAVHTIAQLCGAISLQLIGHP